MKNFLQNLLIFFSLLLCALIAFQWVRETKLRKEVQSLTDTVHTKMETIQGHEVTIRHGNEEIKRLDDIKNKLTQTVKTNEIQLLSLTKELDKVQSENERALVQIEAYKDAIERANENITAQNENIKKQNEEMAKLVEERNSVVSNFNNVAKDFNDLAARWNKQQEELAAIAATNAAAADKKSR
jgi:chromosome segregation ATPase